jgi:hypothetical protein
MQLVSRQMETHHLHCGVGQLVFEVERTEAWVVVSDFNFSTMCFLSSGN